MEYIQEYKGASIYRLEKAENSGSEVIFIKLVAKGQVPENGNMEVIFKGEAQNEKEAIKMLKGKINKYLREHGIRKLIPDQTP